MNITALVIGMERYIWIYGDSNADKAAVIQSAANMADDPQLSLEWHGAAMVADRVCAKAYEKTSHEQKGTKRT